MHPNVWEQQARHLVGTQISGVCPMTVLQRILGILEILCLTKQIDISTIPKRSYQNGFFCHLFSWEQTQPLLKILLKKNLF